MVSTDPSAMAMTVVRNVRNGRFGEVEAQFSPALKAAVTAKTLKNAWLGEVCQRGSVTAFGEPVADPAGPGLTRVQVPVFCSQGGFTVVMVVDDAGALAGVRFATAAVWTPPDYADEKEFAEHEITVRAQPGPVGGTLTLPRGPGPWPGVVLLSGGGIFDRDGTAGPNKPLKDLAWGLASRGVAVLRFDKVTHSRPELAQTAGFTMTTEYVPHAVAAIRFLQRQLAVDSRRVFVVGHSMGGKVAPRVAAAEPSVAGLVLLAADAEPMHQAAVRVVRKLAALDPGVGTDALVETITRQAEVVAGPSLSQSTPTEDLLFGFPASYWLDLRGYDPVAAAAVLDLPMLLLQGGRDYQVTIEDDLARWQTGLAGRPDVTVRVHEAADHLFFPGAGPSSPSDYEHPHHVDPAVVGDIATWVTERESARNP